MDNREKLKELNVLNLIMLVSLLLGIGLGFVIQEVIGGAALGLLLGFIGRMVYLRKKYKEIKKEDSK